MYEIEFKKLNNGKRYVSKPFFRSSYVIIKADLNKGYITYHYHHFGGNQRTLAEAKRACNEHLHNLALMNREESDEILGKQQSII